MSSGAGGAVGRCDTCWWDDSQWDRRDTANVVRRMGTIWRWTTESLDPALVGERPPAPGWSVADHTDHVAEKLTDLVALLAATGRGPSPTDPTRADGSQGDGAQGDGAQGDGAQGDGARIGGAARTLFEQARTLEGEAGWSRLRQGLHVVMHHQYLLGRTLRALGAGAGHQRGTVVAVCVSDGGVPKRAVAEARIGPRGLTGDRQAARQHHGRPSQAVCLWSAEVVASLVGDGHPIATGDAGENLSVSGIRWESIRPGTLVQVGEALLVVTGYAEPCHKTAPYFLARDATVMDHDHHHGGARAYAAVMTAGRVVTGDAVVVEP